MKPTFALPLLLSCIIVNSCSHPTYVTHGQTDQSDAWMQRLTGSEQTIRLRDGTVIRRAKITSFIADNVQYSHPGGDGTVPIRQVIAFTEEEDEGGTLKGMLIGAAAGLAIAQAASPSETGEFIDVSSAVRQFYSGAGIVFGGLIGAGLGSALGSARHEIMTKAGFVDIQTDSLTYNDSAARFRWGDRVYEVRRDSVEVTADSTHMRVRPQSLF